MSATTRRIATRAQRTFAALIVLVFASTQFSLVANASLPDEEVAHAQAVNNACTPKTTTQGAHVVVAFTTVGVCDWSVPAGVTLIDFAVVAGGGGGASRAGGGGGAGGLLTERNRSVSGVSTLTVTVGAGGVGGAVGQNVGTNGSASSMTGTGFTSVSATGGGRGGTAIAVAGNGGSGGGAGGSSTTVGGSNTVGTGIVGQGFGGGGGRNAGCAGSTSKWCAGGGGGAGAVGGAAVSNGAAGSGGIGLALSWLTGTSARSLAVGQVSGTQAYFGGGGGGGADLGGSAGAGGLGGGGAGTIGDTAPGFDAQPNTGGGGGGSGYHNTNSPGDSGGGDGGSGVVIIRYMSTSTTCTGTSSYSENSYTVVAFTVVQSNCSWTIPAGVTSIDYLVVAGGGGAGARHGGGGGAGGLLTSTNYAVTPGVTASITVGTGGVGADVNMSGATSGGNSVLSIGGQAVATSIGGGTQNQTGGSGGGAAAPSSLQQPGNGTAGQGNAGGYGASDYSCSGTTTGWCGGGGGGAGAVGQSGDDANNNRAGNGGIGVTTSLFSVAAAQFMSIGHVSGGAVYFAGGGGGGIDHGGTAGVGGLGGGANGSSNQAVAPSAAMATTGGGGGGGAYNASGNSGGSAGGSGVVVIRYTSTTANGVIDSYANLDGVSQHFYVAEGSVFDSRATYTAEAWIYPTTTCGSMCPVASHDGDYTIMVSNSKILAYIYHSGTAQWNTWNTKITIRTNDWQHVALVRDGAAARFYLNGQLRESFTLGGSTRSTYTNEYPLWLGKHYTNFFTGRIDQFRYWSTARTLSEVVDGMHLHTPSVTTGLIAQYDFNGVTSSTVNNTAPSAAVGTAMTAANSPTYRDVKSTTLTGSDAVVTFPRSYLTSAGGWAVPAGISNVRALVVAGGGGGGSSYDNVGAGGGGAGGLVDRFTSSTVQFTASTAKVVVGTGGAGGGPNGDGTVRSQWQVGGNNGQNSILDSVSAVGGGAGSARAGSGGAGGSGGGAGGRFASNAAGSGTSQQGNNGGKPSVDSSHGGGGGGAGGAGGASSTTVIGAAGAGAALSITGSSVTYAAGGSGGDKASAVTTGTAGGINTGAGGAGGSGVSAGTVGGYGGDGGSGVVVVRYTASSSGCSPVESRVGAYVIVKFDVVGNCNWTVPAGVTSLDYLVVAGGGGGGAYQSGSNGGGGGAGGVLDGSALAVTSTQPLSISVGAGGAGGLVATDGGGDHGDAGSDSSIGGAGFATIIATGGGFGAGNGSTSSDYDGGNGGSGGGALGSAVTSASGGVGTAGPPRQGYDGGANLSSCGAERPAGGGGGASAAGTRASCISDQSGAGGAGRALSITGSSVVYGGGGGGGGFGVANASATPGAGGSGGGGAGGGIRGSDGVDGLGGGGGGAGYDTTVNVNVSGGDGGDGVVVLRYVDRVLTKAEGDNQSGIANTAAGVNPKVRVVNASGAGVDGVTVAFSVGANSGSVGSASVVTSGGGYASTSWTFGSGSSQTMVATLSMSGSDPVTFTATVTGTKNLTYDVNGGSGGPVQVSVNVGATATVSSTVPTRTGYTFGGWNTALNGSGTQYAAGATFTMPATDVTLYAQWSINSYNVVYSANGGSGAPGSASVNYGSTVTISSTRPTRTGYSFTGWNTAANGSGTGYSWNGSVFSPASFVLGAADVTLYAQWSINSYTVTYSANGGSGAPSSQSADYNTSVTVSSSVPTRTGYSFTGWNTAANGSGTSVAANTSYTVTADVTLYAQWSINSYNVVYSANGGSGAPGSASVNYGSTVTISSTRPTRTGYSFTGWNTAANGSGTGYSWNGSVFSPASFVLGAADVTLYAQWSINSYTVTYSANGGSGAPSSQSADYNTSVTVSSSVPTRTGYSFTGWNTAANGSGSDYSGGSSLVVTSDVTLYAKWTVNTYSITYDANNGSGAPSNVTGIAFGASTTLSSTVPTRAGYTFAAWNTVANGSGTTYASGATFAMPANNITLYAQWTATVQTVTYSANGGSGAPSTASVATGATATVSSSVPTRTGYTFQRWNTAANGSGVDYSSGATFTMGASNVTLYAVWLANTYSITYDANGGAAPPASANAQTDSTFTVSASLPTRAGYTLVSWNTVRNGSGTHYAPGATFTMPPNSVTLFAQWSANANNIAYNTNGGSGGPTNSVALTDATATVSSTQPTRTGYTFIGWNTVANGSGTVYAPGASFTMPTTHLTLYAQWTPTTYQVIYNANGGSGAPTASNGAYLSTISLSSTAPTRTGYTFLGWGTLADGNGTNYAAGGSFSVPSQNTTLYAVWVADINDVYYVMNGGANGPTATVAATGDTVTLTSTVPTRTGYTFTGWNTAANGSGTSYAWNGSAFSPATFVMPGSDVFLYAQWSINSYTVTYDTNGGTGSVPSSQTAQYLTAVIVASGSLTRSGWSFTGWNTAANGSGTQHAPGGSLTVGAASITLYAEWVRNVNAVIFDALGGDSAPAVQFGATGTSVSLPTSIPVKEGHTFGGWEDSTSTVHNPGDTITMPVTSVTLFAKWSVNSYLVTYDVNGGLGSVPAAQNTVFATTVTVASSQITRAGYTFARWNTRADGTGTSYDPNATFTMPAAPVTLFAQWALVPVAPQNQTSALTPTTTVPSKGTSASTTTTVPSTPTTTAPGPDEPVVTIPDNSTPDAEEPRDTDNSDGEGFPWLPIGLVGLAAAAIGTVASRRRR